METSANEPIMFPLMFPGVLRFSDVAGGCACMGALRRGTLPGAIVSGFKPWI